MDQTEAEDTKARIAELRAEAETETRAAAKKELLLTANTLEARLARKAG
jgi:hypothetical protein